MAQRKPFAESYHIMLLPPQDNNERIYSCLGSSCKTGLSFSLHCHTIIICIYLETNHTRTHIDRWSKKERDAAAERERKWAIKWRRHHDGGATLASYAAEQLGWRIPLCNCTLGLYKLAARKKRRYEKVRIGFSRWPERVPVHLGGIFWSVLCASWGLWLIPTGATLWSGSVQFSVGSSLHANSLVLLLKKEHPLQLCFSLLLTENRQCSCQFPQ